MDLQDFGWHYHSHLPLSFSKRSTVEIFCFPFLKILSKAFLSISLSISNYRFHFTKQGPEEGGIPSQFPLGEDVQFIQILREAQDFFGIEEEQAKEYFLVDHRTSKKHKMHFISNLFMWIEEYFFCSL